MIKRLDIENFTCFTKNSFEFSPNINVFVGTNGTGKTHILKMLVTLLEFAETITMRKPNKPDKPIKLLTDIEFSDVPYTMATELTKFFKPENLGNLIKTLDRIALINIHIGENSYFDFELNGNITTTENTNVSNVMFPGLDIRYADLCKFTYIPPREMLSLFEGFLALNKKREISFDETYVKLAESLDVPLLKGEGFEEGKKLIEPLTKALNIEVIKDNGRFYIQDAKGRKLEAHLVAEGWRKLASIMYLALNGELSKNSILFWDEPEANLNPKLIRAVAEFLHHLAKQGIQIFIATHDYLLTHYLSLYSEYAKREDPQTKFFCLNKNDNNDIEVEEGSSLADLENNPIMEEYAAYYDAEQKYFSGN